MKKHFKEATYLKLSSLAENNDFLLLNNYKIDFDDSHVGLIDHLLISKKYIFAINDFSLSGVISGELRGRYLKVVNLKKQAADVSNPLNYNINLIKRLTMYNNLSQSYVKGIVVINDDSEINIKNQSNQFYMVKRKDLKSFILNIDKEDIGNLNEESIVKFIYKLSKQNKEYDDTKKDPIES
ncbi:MAG: NERD domain-containing protein [Bacilli bacterium]|nr:NERD domain-containing protein [Bacilli bacterium]